MSYQRSSRGEYAPTAQTDIQFDQINPVQNTWYTILATLNRVRINYILFYVNDVAETLQVEILIDGVTYTATQAALAGTSYSLQFSPADNIANVLYVVPSGQMPLQSFLMEGRSVQIRMRKTTAGGVATIRAKLCYSRW